MAKRLYTYIIIVAAIVLSITGCTDGKQGMVQSRLPHDTLYTEQKAIAVYGYDPVRALQIVDSAVIVGNMSSWQADKNRARIYSLTRAGERLDSLMHWTPDARFDTARIIGEQLIRHDSIKNSLERQQDVLEILAYVARCQKDTTSGFGVHASWWKYAAGRVPRPRPFEAKRRLEPRCAIWDRRARAWR